MQMKGFTGRKRELIRFTTNSYGNKGKLHFFASFYKGISAVGDNIVFVAGDSIEIGLYDEGEEGSSPCFGIAVTKECL